MTQALSEIKKLYPFRDLKYIYSKAKEPEAVQMTMEDFLGLMETLQIQSNKKLMRSIQRGLKDAQDGKLYTHDEVFG